MNKMSFKLREQIFKNIFFSSLNSLSVYSKILLSASISGFLVNRSFYTFLVILECPFIFKNEGLKDRYNCKFTLHKWGLLPAGHSHNRKGWSEASAWGNLTGYQHPRSWVGRWSQDLRDSLVLLWLIQALYSWPHYPWPHGLLGRFKRILLEWKGYLLTNPGGQRGSVGLTLLYIRTICLLTCFQLTSQLLIHLISAIPKTFSVCFLLASLWQDRFQFLFLCFTKLVTGLPSM